MALSNSTINKLSSALTPEVIESIQQDDRYVEFMMEIIPEIVIEKLGTQDIDLVTELAMCIMDRIYIKCN